MQAASRFVVKTAMIITVCLLCAQTGLAQTAQRSFYAAYGALKSQRFVKMESVFKEERMLEQLADSLSAVILPLSSPIVLTLQECGKSSAFFDSQNHKLVFCYELVEEMRQRAYRDFEQLPGLLSTPGVAAPIAGGAFTFVFLHELGHVLIYAFKLPITGREEDVADQIAAYIALKTEEAAITIQGGAWFFSKTDIFYTRQHYADEHSLDPQRRFNIVCWAYGKNPQLFTPLAKKVGLTVERARRCQSEYAQMARSLELIFRATGR